MSFWNTYKELCAKFEVHKLNDFSYIEQYKELIKIIAEVCVCADEGKTYINIEGEPLPARTVAEVYEGLTSEHLIEVTGKFNRIPYLVKNKKAYLRTALYNIVFEFESGISNEVNVFEQ